MASFRRKWAISLVAVLVAYFALVPFLRHHSLLDIVTSAPLASLVSAAPGRMK